VTQQLGRAESNQKWIWGVMFPPKKLITRTLREALKRYDIEVSFDDGHDRRIFP